MLQQIINFDIQLFLELNSHHNSFFDTLMVWFSKTSFWIPLHLAILGLIYHKYKIKTIAITLFVILVVTMADQISVHLFKEVFERLRPSHNPDLQGLIHHVNGYKGGKYGFVSSHAANTFAVAVYTLLILKNKTYTLWILFWAALVSYSRIYLGVHYPGDIICGGLLGAAIGTLVYLLYFFADKHYTLYKKKSSVKA